MYHLFIFTFHDIFIIIVYFKNMEESSKISKFYKSQRNDLQLRYLNRKYTIKNRVNRLNFKNNEYKGSTAGCNRFWQSC